MRTIIVLPFGNSLFTTEIVGERDCYGISVVHNGQMVAIPAQLYSILLLLLLHVRTQIYVYVF